MKHFLKVFLPFEEETSLFPQNVENDDLNMFSDNGTALLMNSNFLATSRGIKLVDYIIHL